jgi:hypothetical protein
MSSARHDSESVSVRPSRRKRNLNAGAENLPGCATWAIRVAIVLIIILQQINPLETQTTAIDQALFGPHKATC